MKNIGQIASSIDLTNPKQESELSKEAQELINQLFIVLEKHVIYFRMNKMRNQQEANSSRREWVKTFIQNNVTKEQIEIGIKNIRSTIHEIKDLTPGGFLKMCEVNKSKEEKCNVPLFLPTRGDVRDENSVQIARNTLGDLKKMLLC